MEKGEYKMSIIFSNVSVDEIVYIKNRFNIQIKFIDTIFGSLKSVGDIKCIDIFSLKMEADEAVEFPCFVCDVDVTKFEDEQTPYLLKFLGSELEVSITCKDIEISKI